MSRRRRGPAEATPEILEKAALAYLARYHAAVGQLRRVLERRVRRAAAAHGSDPAEGRREIERLLARLVAQGWLDDRAYARARAEALWQHGTSLYAIRAKLKAKGVADADIAPALADLEASTAAPDLLAALAFARRRRLGPFRPPESRAERRDRDLAALSRQGFAFATARQVVDAEDPEDLAAAADGRQ